MFKIKIVAYIIAFILLGCQPKKKNKEERVEVEKEENVVLNSRYQKLLDYPVDSLSFPRSADSLGQIKKVPSGDWTSGFFAGNLWQLYQLTEEQEYRDKAQQWTVFIEKEKLNGKSHDVGFKVFCSFGNGLEVNPENKHYQKVVVKAANTLASRYSDKVKSIRSWDFNKKQWQFPVIIDNMMNLELLFEAAKIAKDSTFYEIAVNHANTTLKNHFRENNSTFHVVDYDSLSGNIHEKVTHQGFNDSSSWARGQAWAIYGFTMAYRYTQNERYLNQAKATVKFFINHKNLPEDGIPYWDFNDPDIPQAPRDVSAATVVASGLLELYTYTQEEPFLAYAEKVLHTLNSKEYLLKTENEIPFIFKHSTGNYPKNDEIDVPIVYADYYYLEALLRKKKFNL